jgi:double-stranded uracil-DNA glycosylase
MDRATVAIYEANADAWARRRPARPEIRRRARALAATAGRPVVDLGTGPGRYLRDLAPGRAVPIAVDAAGAMLDLARRAHRRVLPVRADIERLPFRRGALGGAFARNSYVHLPRAALPAALAHVHAALAVDAPMTVSMISGTGEGALPDDDFAGRFFARWPADDLVQVFTGAGFSDVCAVENDTTIWLTCRRGRTLPDFVGPGMRVLVCGLNPSVVAADAGFGYAGPTNRFWPAAVGAGLVTCARDPWHALEHDGVGMTDLVKRATPGAAELSAAEYRAGASRVEHLVAWLQPGLVVFVGLAGWRAAFDRRASPGPQPDPFAGVPVYVMPSTSGLNARTSLGELTDHLKRALDLSRTEGRRRAARRASAPSRRPPAPGS